jgi:hypothetical protein
MKIPKSFQLLGKRYEVVMVPVEEWSEEELVGLCSPQKLEVSIKCGLKPQLQEHIYLHEMMHAIFDAMGEEKLYTDEAFIDTLAGLLHQALTSDSPAIGRNKKRR